MSSALYPDAHCYHHLLLYIMCVLQLKPHPIVYSTGFEVFLVCRLLVANEANVQTKRKMNQKCMVGQMADQSKRDLVGIDTLLGGTGCATNALAFLVKIERMGKGEGLISTVLQLIFNPRGGLYSPSPILFLLTATCLAEMAKAISLQC